MVPTAPRRRPALPRRYAGPAARVVPAPPALGLALGLALALTGCSTVTGDGSGGGAGEDRAGDPPSTPAPSPTPLADLDTRTVVVPREDPCDGVPEAAVVDALGAPAADARRWADGERAALAPGVRDVAHEWGCAFVAADGGAARAWVFSPPVTPQRARAVAGDVVADERCQALEDAAGFGLVSAARVCRQGDVLVAAWSGLFGDAWLSCSLSAPRDEADTPVAREALVARTEVWCGQVLAAAREE